MSFAQDMIIGKWLVKSGFAPKADVEKALGKIKKAEAEGVKVSNLLTSLVKSEVISKDQLGEVKAAWAAHQKELKSSTSKHEVSSAVPSESGTDSPKPESETEPPIGANEDIESADAASAADQAQPDSAEEEEQAQSAEADKAEERTESAASPEPDEADLTSPLPDQKGQASKKPEKVSSQDQGPEMVVCPECQSQTDRSEKDCSTCGATLPTASYVTCKVCDTTQKKRGKECRKCGCHIESSKPGRRTLVCRDCQAVAIPGQVICLSCGSPRLHKKQAPWAKLGSAIALVEVLALGVCTILLLPKDHLKSKTSIDSEEVIVFSDPYEHVQARAVSEEFNRGALDQKNKTWMSQILESQPRWDQLEEPLLEKEDALGVHGALMLGVMYFEQDRGFELVALAKAHPSIDMLNVLARAYRMKEAKKQYKRFEMKQALAQMETWLDDGADSSQYFWGGVLAFLDQDYARAKPWFEKAIAAETPIAQAHMFLYLLKLKEPEKAKMHLDELWKGLEKAESLKGKIKPFLPKS